MNIAVPERGSFPATHPVAAMAMPLAARKSGVLTLRHGKVRHDIAYVEGRATGVDSNAVKESLPVLLVAKGSLTQEQSSEALAALRDRGATVDQVLVERGWIPAEEIEELLRWRAAILVVKTAAWSEGKYTFRAMAHPRLSGPELPLRMPQLLLQGLLRCEPGHGVFLPVRRMLDHHVRWAADAASQRDDYVLEDTDRALVEAVEGARTLGDVLSASRLPGDRAQAIAWLLMVCGAIEAQAAEAAPPAAEPEEASLELDLDEGDPIEAIVTPVDSGPAQAVAPAAEPEPTPTATPTATQPDEDDSARKARLAKLEASLFGADAQPIVPKQRSASWGSAEGVTVPIGAATTGGAAGQLHGDGGDGKAAAMRKVLKQMQRQDHFENLGVPQDADEDMIRKAYFLLAKQYHPDRYSGESDEVYQLAESIFALIGEANEVLSSASSREEYLHRLIHGDEEELIEEEALAQFNQILDAEQAFKTGMRVLTAGRIPAAHEHFRRAYEGYPEEQEYQCYYGYTSYRMKLKADPLGAKGGIEMIKVVLEANPEHGVALHLLGKIEMLKGDFKGAMKLLRKAQRARPADDDINRDYRRAEHESLKPKKSEGLGSMLGGLFGKKKK